MHVRDQTVWVMQDGRMFYVFTQPPQTPNVEPIKTLSCIFKVPDWDTSAAQPAREWFMNVYATPHNLTVIWA